MSAIEPHIHEGVPLCMDSCPSHDGKRCAQLGRQPDTVCTPAVQAMAAELSELRAQAAELVVLKDWHATKYIEVVRDERDEYRTKLLDLAKALRERWGTNPAPQVRDFLDNAEKLLGKTGDWWEAKAP